MKNTQVQKKSKERNCMYEYGALEVKLEIFSSSTLPESHPFDRLHWFPAWLLVWLDNTIQTGDDLTESDIPACPVQQTSSVNYEKTIQVLSCGQKSLMVGLWHCYGHELRISWLLSVLSCAGQLFPPWLVRKLLEDLEDQKNGAVVPICWGLKCSYWYALGILCCYMIVSVSLSLIQVNHVLLACKIRSALISMIYRKSMNTAQHSTLHLSPTNLISSDVERIFQLAFTAQFLWTPVVMILTTTAVMWKDIGPTALVGSGTMLAIVFGQGIITAQISKHRRSMAKATDARVQQTREIFNGIRTIKLCGWEELMLQQVLTVRVKELRKLWQILRCRAVSAALMFTTPSVAAMLMFSTYALVGGTFSVPIVFSLFAYLIVVRPAIYGIPPTISNLAESFTAMKRIEEYLHLPEKGDATSFISNNTLPPGGVLVTNGAFSWKPPLNPDERPFLSGINFQVHPGQLICVLGEVASGKSLLLNALLGEIPCLGGNVDIAGQVAYCAQEAWLQNGTIQQNILFTSKLEPTWYAKVIEVCQLQLDIENFPQGDLTEVGGNGITLSGGQKARVALARAVYRLSQTTTFILDDILSAVDARVAQMLVCDCLLGILSEKTRIVAVNYAFPALIQAADKVLILKNGKLIAFESWENIEPNLKSPFCVSLPHLSEQQPQQMEKPASPRKGNRTSINPESVYISSSTHNFNREVEISAARSSWLSTQPLLLQYLENASNHGSLTCIGVLGLVTVAEAFRIGCDVWLSWWAQRANELESSDRSWATKFAVGYAVVVIGLCAAALLRSLWFAKVACASSGRLHDDAVRSLIKAPTTSFFDVTPTGNLLNSLTKDMDAVDSQLPDALQMLLMNSCFVLGVLTMCACTAPWYLVCLVPLFWYFMKVQRLFTTATKKMKHMEAKSRNPLYCALQETVQGCIHIRSMGATATFFDNFKTTLDRNSAMLLSTYIMSPWILLRVNGIAGWIVFAVSIASIVTTNTRSQGAFIGLGITYSMQLLSQMYLVVRSSVEVENQFTSFERVAQLTLVPQEIDFVSEMPQLVAPDWPLQGAILFEKVSVSYVNRHHFLALKEVSFEILPRQSIGICGRTGAGKTTLMNCLCRLVNPIHGQILVDNINICHVPLSVLRKRIAIIPQQPLLFSGSIYFNVDPESKFSMSTIHDTLQKVKLLDSIPEKSETARSKLLSFCGQSMSVGQRQLLCIARILLHESRIVLFDEATSNIDSQSEEIIQGVIDSHFKSKSTLVVIAHRLQTITKMDKICVLEEGEICEYGSPSELAAQRGVYWSLLHSSVAL